jgi:hypothetical protein
MKYFSRTMQTSGALFAAMLVLSVPSGVPAQQSPIFKEDLHPYGFLTSARVATIINYTDVNFLTDALLLVTVNQVDFSGSRFVTYPLGDRPPAKLLLFDVSQKILLKSKDMAIEKETNSVRAIAGGRFALINEAGLQICSPDLKCGPSLAARGSVKASPAGTRIVVGGPAFGTEQLLDAASLKVLDHFSTTDSDREIAGPVIPGDDGLLLQLRGTQYLRLAGQPDRQLPFPCCPFQPAASFINATTIADIESDKALVVEKTDGTILYRIRIRARPGGGVETIPAQSGARFCLHETGWTALNSAMNLGFDEDRDFTAESIRVFAADSGKILFDLHENPRPYLARLSTPALSPDGHRLAMIRRGFLEVFEIP